MPFLTRAGKLTVTALLTALLPLIAAAQPPTAAGPGESPAEEARPAPRHPDGRPILGSVPGEPTGAWDGFGSRPMLIEFDEVPPGSIIAHTPYEQLRNDPDRYPKIKYSDVPYKPWAKALFEARSRTRFEPYVRCKPSAGAREVATAYGTQFVEFPDQQQIYIFPVGGPRHFRVIHMDGRDHPADLTPSYHGHSIGRWEGDSLVVDTVGFNEKMWIDAEGSPHTEQLHLVERFTRLNHDTLRYDIRIDDPGAYTSTWESGFYMNWREGESFEFVCQDENEASELMLGTEYESMDRSRPFIP